MELGADVGSPVPSFRVVAAGGREHRKRRTVLEHTRAGGVPSSSDSRLRDWGRQ